MTKEYQTEIRTTFADTNLVGNVYFAEFVSWQGKCREEFLMDYAPSVVDDLGRGVLGLLTLSCSMQYYDEVFANQRITIGMRLANLHSNRFSMNFSYYREGKVVAVGEQAVGCFESIGEGWTPVAVPAELGRALEEFAPVGSRP